MKISQVPTAEGVGAIDHAAPRRALLRGAMLPLADELRLVDCADLVSTVLRGQLANLDDLVQSSLEPYYLPNAFSFGWAAEAVLGWDDGPELRFEMEFCASGITAFFALHLTGTEHDVDIRFVGFETPDDPGENTGRLAAALRAACRPQAPDKFVPPR